MTRLLLIRHGNTDAVGRTLVGRLPGVPLNAEGREQAARVAAALAGARIDAIYSSPLERATQTASAIAQPHGLEVAVREGLTEIDFGAWTGRAIAELRGDEQFRRFNVQRAAYAPPGGESSGELQARMARELTGFRDRHPNQLVAVVGHSDPLRAAVCFFLGLSVDFLLRLEMAPASLTLLDLSHETAVLRFANHNGGEPAL